MRKVLNNTIFSDRNIIHAGGNYLNTLITYEVAVWTRETEKAPCRHLSPISNKKYGC
jgi:hypothetical protein